MTKFTLATPVSDVTRFDFKNIALDQVELLVSSKYLKGKESEELLRCSFVVFQYDPQDILGTLSTEVNALSATAAQVKEHLDEKEPDYILALCQESGPGTHYTIDIGDSTAVLQCIQYGESNLGEFSVATNPFVELLPDADPNDPENAYTLSDAVLQYTVKSITRKLALKHQGAINAFMQVAADAPVEAASNEPASEIIIAKS